MKVMFMIFSKDSVEVIKKNAPSFIGAAAVEEKLLQERGGHQEAIFHTSGEDEAVTIYLDEGRNEVIFSIIGE